MDDKNNTGHYEELGQIQSSTYETIIYGDRHVWFRDDSGGPSSSDLVQSKDSYDNNFFCGEKISRLIYIRVYLSSTTTQ